jgi:phosphoserine phosphatase
MTFSQTLPLLTVYVDVDDTLVRSVGTKRIPIPAAVRHVRDLKQQGAELYCWSSGGAEYARRSAEELGVADCFTAFLPKPQVLLDDQEIGEWRRFLVVHPAGSEGQSVEEYKRRLAER